MASGEAIPVEPLQHKTIVLRTSIHCPGCSKKVKRIIQSIPGIHNFAIDASQNKVSITGVAEAGVIIKKFLKSNKQVELWPEKSKPSTNIANAKTSSEKNHSKEINASSDLSENKKSDEERFKDKAKTVDAEAPSKAEENDPKTQRGSAVAADVDDGSKKCENQEGNKSGGNCSGGAEKKEKMAAQKETNSAGSRAAESPATEGGDSSGGGEKKEKMVVQKETNSAGSGGVESSSATEGTTSLPPPPLLQQPQNMTYQTPAPTAAYVMSYNMAQPSTAHSYYAFPATPPPSQGYFYSSYAPPPPPPPPEFFHGLPSEWGSPAPPPESYHMFNDENANSCNVM